MSGRSAASAGRRRGLRGLVVGRVREASGGGCRCGGVCGGPGVQGGVEIRESGIYTTGNSGNPRQRGGLIFAMAGCIPLPLDIVVQFGKVRDHSVGTA